jgi:hypothetical protein
MAMLFLLVASAAFLLRTFIHCHGRAAARLTAILAEVEAAAPVVIADWPAAHRDAIAALLASERTARSSVYRHELHTVSTRVRDYGLLERISAAETRMKVAEQLASKSGLNRRFTA